MKTTSRRSTALLCAMAVIATLIVAPATHGQGSISSVWGLGPVNANQSFVNDVTYALSHGLDSYGSWQSIPNSSSVNVANIFRFGASGGALYCALAVSSPTPFSLGSIYSTQVSPLFNFQGTIGADRFSYSNFGYGIAPDGTTVYNSGNVDALVNTAYIIGYNFSISANGYTLAQAIDTWSSITPFNYDVTYNVNGLNTSSTVTFVTPAPEPATTTLCILGGVGIWAVVRRRRQN